MIKAVMMLNIINKKINKGLSIELFRLIAKNIRVKKLKKIFAKL